MDPTNNATSLSSIADGMGGANPVRPPANSRLSERVIEQIFSFLPFPALVRANEVSKRWSAVAHSPRLLLEEVNLFQKFARSESQVVKVWNAGYAPYRGDNIKFCYESDAYLGINTATYNNRTVSAPDVPYLIDRKQFAEVVIPGVPSHARIVEVKGHVALLFAQKEKENEASLHIADLQAATQIRQVKFQGHTFCPWIFSHNEKGVVTVDEQGFITLWDISGSEAVNMHRVQDAQITTLHVANRVNDLMVIYGGGSMPGVRRLKPITNTYRINSASLLLVKKENDQNFSYPLATSGNLLLAPGPRVHTLDDQGNGKPLWEVTDSAMEFCTYGNTVLSLQRHQENQETSLKFRDLQKGGLTFSCKVNHKSDFSSIALADRIAAVAIDLRRGPLHLVHQPSQCCLPTHIQLTSEGNFSKICDVKLLKNEILIIMQSLVDSGARFSLMRLNADRLLPTLKEEDLQYWEQVPMLSIAQNKNCVVM